MTSGPVPRPQPQVPINPAKLWLLALPGIDVFTSNPSVRIAVAH